MFMVKVLIVKNYEELSLETALRIAEAVRSKPDIVLGLATGGTPLGCYRELIRMHREEGLSFSKVTTFNLDEYVGLPPSHPQSYHYYMFHNLFDHVDVRRENVHIPDGMAEDLDEECRRYEEAIKEAGGIDLQLLGIGRNGHIGFNEPGSPFDSRTRVVKLSEQTRKDNARFFNSIDEVPTHAITMGIGTIMEARRIILIASGEAKAEAIAKAVKGPKTVDVPASALQDHPDCLFIIDKEAASLL
ncbi:MAG: glucosamine-6-phosphate deaminase [Candidatus Bathyarchaeota archaeon B24]|nr:MAG: glucosamine-6-phosphate deaminase [Candidatus Bathyarchaeota archaeon B24]